MQVKQIFLVVLVVLVAYFLFSFFGSSSEVKQIISYSDFNVNKSINFSSGVSEEYSFYSKDPLVCLIVSKNELTINAESFTTQVIKPNSIYLFEPLNYSPGLNSIKTNFSSSKNRTIAFFIPLKDFSAFSETQKQELFNSLTAVSELDINYFSTIESLKIMQEYADSISKKKTLSEEKTKEIKISFAENEVGNFFSNVIDSIVNDRQSDGSASSTNQQNNVSGVISSNQTSSSAVSQTIEPADYIDAISKVALERNSGESIASFESSDFVLTINFKPEAKTFPSKIVIPYSRENPLVIWNGEIETQSSELKEFNFQKENSFEENILFEYSALDKNEGENTKYIFSFIVDTTKVSESFKVVKGLIVENGPFPEKYSIEIILIENPCEKRINQYTEFENDYHADYLKQVELYKASGCFTNLATINLQNLEKPDQNQVGRETQLSTELITELSLDEQNKKQLIEQQKQKREKYFTEFKQAQKVLDQNFLETIINSKIKINTSEEYIKLIEDKNALNELKLKNIYAKLILEEKNLILDPTDFEAFKRKTELEIEFYLKSNQIDLNDDTKKEEIESLRELIYANNYAKHGAWDSETIRLELSMAKYSLEQDLYASIKALADKMSFGFRGMGWVCLDSKVYSDAFDPYSKSFNTKMNQSFRETILYIGLSKELILEEKAIERLGKHVDSYCGSTRSPVIKFSYKFDSSYDLERTRILELFKEYLGLKLVMGLAYDVNTIQSKISAKKAEGYGTDRTDINYYPKGLEYSVVDGNKTLQQIFLADETKLGEWIYGKNYDAMMHLADGQQAKKYLTAVYFGSINPKIKTIEHFKFREFIEDISQADQLASQQAMFDSIASVEYQKVIELKEKEGKMYNWNYFITNLFELRTVDELQAEINFKIEALKGINQIQELLLDGYNLQQIEQENADWKQKPYFDSQENQIEYQRIYEIAKNSGAKTAKIEISTQNSDDFTPFTEGIGEFLNKKKDNIQLALLLTPIRNEFVKTYKMESVKVLNKGEIEKAETLEEAEQIIFPESYKAEILFRNAEYYYNESMYLNAYQIYEDIKLFYPKTNFAIKANEQLKKFTTWKMVFSKPYWETYGKMGAEFLTASELAKYFAFGATIKYIIIPDIFATRVVNSVQQAKHTQIVNYFIKIKSQLSKAFVLKTHPKLLMTKTQSNITEFLRKIETVNDKIKVIGKFFANISKKIKGTKLYKIVTYDVVVGGNYNDWLKGIAQRAAMRETQLIDEQISTLFEAEIPAYQMNSKQLIEMKDALNILRNHNVFYASNLEKALDERIQAIIYMEELAKKTNVTTIAAPSIQESASVISNTSTQLPLSLAKINQATKLGGLPKTISSIPVLRQGEIIGKMGRINEIELKRILLQEELAQLEKGLTKAKTSTGMVADSFLKYLEERIDTTKLDLAKLSSQIEEIGELKIACSLCAFKVKTSAPKTQVVGETQLTPTQTLQVDPSLPLNLTDVSIKGVEKAKLTLDQVIVPSLENATLSMTKVAPDTILLKILTPKEIQIITPLNSSFEIIPNTKPIEETTSLIKTPIKIRGGLQWNTDDFLKRNPNYFENRQGLTSGTNFEVNSSPGEVHSIRGERTPLLTHDSLGSPMYLKKLTLEIDKTTINPDTEIIVKRIPVKNSYVSKTIQVSYSLTGPNQITIYVTQPEYAQIEVIGERTLLDQGLNKLQNFFESKIKPLFEKKGNAEIIPNSNCENGCSITLITNKTITQAEEGVLAQTDTANALEKVDFKRIGSITLPLKLPTNPNLTQDKILEFKEIAKNLANDPTSILFEEQYLPVKGAVVDKKLFIEQVSREFEFNPYLAETFNGTEVFHGTTSETLYNLINQGGIKPFGELEANGYIPFIGTHDIGSAIGINRTAVSTTLITNYGGAARYAGEKEILITRELIQKNINYLTNELNQLTSESSGSMAEIEFKHNLNIANQRLARFDSLTEAEKEFFEVQFPILFGIKSARPNSYLFVNSDISHEIGLKSGANLDEIRVIYVPENRITQVETYLSKNTSTKHIKVASLEKLTGRTITPITNESSLNNKINQLFERILNFTCHSPCVWNNSSPVKIIENPFDNIEIKGDFSQIEKTQIVEYSPKLVANDGLAQALKSTPNLAPTQIKQIETAMKQEQIIATIQQGTNGQEIIVYVPINENNLLSQVKPSYKLYLSTAENKLELFSKSGERLLNRDEIILTLGQDPSLAKKIILDLAKREVNQNDCFFINSNGEKESVRDLLVADLGLPLDYPLHTIDLTQKEKLFMLKNFGVVDKGLLYFYLGGDLDKAAEIMVNPIDFEMHKKYFLDLVGEKKIGGNLPNFIGNSTDELLTGLLSGTIDRSNYKKNIVVPFVESVKKKKINFINLDYYLGRIQNFDQIIDNLENPSLIQLEVDFVDGKKRLVFKVNQNPTNLRISPDESLLPENSHLLLNNERNKLTLNPDDFVFLRRIIFLDSKNQNQMSSFINKINSNEINSFESESRKMSIDSPVAFRADLVADESILGGVATSMVLQDGQFNLSYENALAITKGNKRNVIAIYSAKVPAKMLMYAPQIASDNKNIFLFNHPILKDYGFFGPGNTEIDFIQSVPKNYFMGVKLFYNGKEINLDELETIIENK